jgi:signal transduction histidine kinase
MAPSDSGKLGLVSLQPLLASIVAIQAPAATESGVSIELRVPDDLPNITGDAEQLVQLFGNLIRNAIEAMPRGGVLTVDAARRAASFTDYVGVEIVDQGLGIESAIRHRVFEPFFTTKPAGTGLGLAICREIADFHGATLSLLPRPGETGTTARVMFPVVLAAQVELSRTAVN